MLPGMEYPVVSGNGTDSPGRIEFADQSGDDG